MTPFDSNGSVRRLVTGVWMMYHDIRGRGHFCARTPYCLATSLHHLVCHFLCYLLAKSRWFECWFLFCVDMCRINVIVHIIGAND